MNTRQTIRNRSELEMDNSDEERDREREEFERHRERDLERHRERDRQRQRARCHKPPSDRSRITDPTERCSELQADTTWRGVRRKPPEATTPGNHQLTHPQHNGGQTPRARSPVPWHRATRHRERRPGRSYTTPGERKGTCIKWMTETIWRWRHGWRHFRGHIHRRGGRGTTGGDTQQLTII